MAKFENFSFQNFISNMKHGSRPNQFVCNIELPSIVESRVSTSGEFDEKFRFQVEATAQPGKSISQIPLGWRGLIYKMIGDAEVDDWNVTVRNDSDYIVRDTIEAWHELLSGNVTGEQLESERPEELMSTGYVYQLDKNSNILKEYEMIGIWPTTVGEMQNSYEDSNTIQTFDVTFAVQWVETNVTLNKTGGEDFS